MKSNTKFCALERPRSSSSETDCGLIVEEIEIFFKSDLFLKKVILRLTLTSTRVILMH
jgi:hypothetical protein